MSAVARRRAAGHASSPKPPSPATTEIEEDGQSEKSPKARVKRKRSVVVKLEKRAHRTGRVAEDEEGAQSPVTVSTQSLIQNVVAVPGQPLERAISPPQLPSTSSPILKSPVPVSTFIPTKQNSTIKPDGVSELRLRGSEVCLLAGLFLFPRWMAIVNFNQRLVILGSYGVRVVAGEVTLYGAHVRPSDGIIWVHAPHCHAVPVLRSGEQTVVQLHPHPHSDSLRRLERLSPLFRKLWNDQREGRPQTYQLITSPDQIPKRTVVQDLSSPAEWNKAISEITATRTPSVLICGPKSSGKSTFGRILCNKLLASKSTSKTGVAVLDLDPGQPEFTPAGLVSLVHCRAPNQSPPFTHALCDDKATTVHRSHATGSITPASDPQLYIDACLDLFSHYTRSLSQYPLIVNTPGWIQGTGLDLLVDLISGINPSYVVYMSEEGPADSVDSLSNAARGVFVTLPSQQSEYSSRSAAHLRAMQTMSYFHSSIDSGSSFVKWDSAPITAKVPWEVSFGGAEAALGIAAVLSYEYQPPAELLAEAINGSVLSLVEIESLYAFPKALACSEPDAMDVDADADAESISRATAKLPVSRSPEGIPFIPNPASTPLSPAHSQALGHVLVRGIDPTRQTLQLLTPIPIERIARARAAGRALVLVLGKLDAPAWAYTESMYEQQAFRSTGGGESAAAEDDDEDGSSDGGDESESEAKRAGRRRRVVGAEGDVPWVEVLEGDEKRPVGSKVWRVRRDLGRGD